MSRHYLVVTKADCPTCRLIEPALCELSAGAPVEIINQDSSDFPTVPAARCSHDATLERSFDLAIEIVPSLLCLEDGVEVARTEGWDRTPGER